MNAVGRNENFRKRLNNKLIYTYNLVSPYINASIEIPSLPTAFPHFCRRHASKILSTEKHCKTFCNINGMLINTKKKQTNKGNVISFRSYYI
jgi:hypothetical protein